MLALDKLKIDILAGSKFLIRRHDEIFSRTSLDFLKELSSALIEQKNNKYPEIKALGFWLRERNIKKFLKKYVDDRKRIGLGYVYHITPSNIPTNFAYSFIFGLVSGNSNIIKISGKQSVQVDIIINTIKKLLGKNKFKELKKSNLFIRYQNNEEVNKFLSENCEARVIWGGNETINFFRKYKIGYRTREINFPDRFSICIINARKMTQLKDDELDILVKNFYNDTFLVDQNACSSPRLIVWYKSKPNDGRQRFWKRLSKKISNYNLNNTLIFEKYTILCNILSGGKVKLVSKLNESKIYLTKVSSLKNISFLSNLKLGIFTEYSTKSLEDVFKIDVSALQTLSYFGFTKEELLDVFSKNKKRSIDRIVPIGSTLEMDMDWDGFPVPHILSRIVNVK